MNNYPVQINDPALGPAVRLEALRSWESGKPKAQTPAGGEINNHIHTIYSFSPYTPAMAALMARDSGLCAAGSVDHDSAAASGEMLDACAVLGIGGCVGFEMRVSFKQGPDGGPGPFAGRKINNPDSEGYAYMTVQGLPGQAIAKAGEFLAPVREQRLERTRAMSISASAALREAGMEEIDFERDILAASKYGEGGGITERHLLAAMAEKLILKYGKGPGIPGGLGAALGIKVSPKIAALLSDPANPHYLYDLLGVLKSEFLPRVYLQPGESECIPARRVTAFADSIGAVPAYAYLGDVGESPTGDKKAEKFEDGFIEELFAELSRLGYRAVAYMPPRNTPAQLRNLRRLCAEWGFMEISGVDINSSRQSFNCPEVLRDEFRHLLDTTWALIAHERLSSADPRFGLFSPENPLAGEGLPQRLALYAAAGKKLDLFHPGDSAAEIALQMEKGSIDVHSP
ncbi:MAG: PHP domain-containing protein [Treponema sp.]|nr:PHP domain-containing protein [Treponema sp.]